MITDIKLIRLAVLTLLVVLHHSLPSLAQGLEADGAIETIVGSDVKTGEERAKADPERIIAAIGQSRANAGKIRMLFNLDELEIVYLPDLAAEGENSEIGKALDTNKDHIEELRQAIEGSAIFYHAIDSRSLLLRDIVAVEFHHDNSTATIFSTSEPSE
ncbi:MAG: hypothetical protein H6893_15290 [Brucellaceae bacterium]|nr:hypothetical protein [Brucellaceae bacterium]